jgi:Proton-conducting membrane transporter
MNLLAFVICCGAGFLAGLMARPSGGPARFVTIVGLAAAFGAAILIGSADTVTIGDVKLVGGAYAGLFLACGTGTALLLCVVGLGTVWPERLGPAALAFFGCLAVAMTATDAGVALMAAALAATVGALVIVRPGDQTEPGGGLVEMRTIGLVVGALLLAAVAILRPAWTSRTDDPIFVLGLLGLGLAIAVRGGAVPFHGPAARLRTRATPMASVLLLVWMPAGLGVLAVGWNALAFHVGGNAMNAVVVLLQTVAVATLLLGAVGALIHDDLGEIAAYSIVQDGAFVLLALAARSDTAAEPARLWLLAFIATKTALVVWVSAASRAFGTSNLGQLRGWLRRAPVLGVALVLIVVATLGWPGAAVFEARASLIRLGLAGNLGFLGAAAMLLSIAYYGRLLFVGSLSPGEAVRGTRGERPRWGRRSHPAPATAGVGTVDAVIVSEPIVEATAAEAAPEAAPQAALKVGAPKVSRRSRTAAAAAAAAAAEEPMPTVTAPVEVLQLGLSVGDEATAELVPTSPEPTPTAPAPSRLGPRRRIILAWRLNRTAEVSLVVAFGAALALAVAFGSLGASSATRSGIPLDAAAHATPTPSPIPTATPRPTADASASPLLQPTESAEPNASGNPGDSGLPSDAPTPTPVRTLAPLRTIGS